MARLGFFCAVFSALLTVALTVGCGHHRHHHHDLHWASSTEMHFHEVVVAAPTQTSPSRNLHVVLSSHVDFGDWPVPSWRQSRFASPIYQSRVSAAVVDVVTEHGDLMNHLDALQKKIEERVQETLTELVASLSERERHDDGDDHEHADHDHGEGDHDHDTADGFRNPLLDSIEFTPRVISIYFAIGEAPRQNVLSSGGGFPYETIYRRR